jgi:acetyltransferase-like isoleucine patch superfamily enzyme
MPHERSAVHPGVVLGKGTLVGPFCELGVAPKGYRPGELKTRIGADCTVRSHTVIYAGVVIGDRFQSGHGALIREHTQIGHDVSVGSHSVVEFKVEIGSGARIHSNVFIPEYSELEEGAWVGPGAIFTNVLHPLCPEVKQCIKGPTVRRGAKIGAGAVLGPGIEVGEDALIGSGSMVITDVPPRTVWVGNPARQVKDIDALSCPWNYIERPYPPRTEKDR